MKIQTRTYKKTTTFRNLFLLAVSVTVLAGGLLFATRPTHAYTSDAFVMRVKTDNAGTSGANQFTIPAQTFGVAPNYNVDCNDDGVIDISNATAAATCTYPSAGTYTVAITGTFPRINFNNGGDKDKLLEIRQWGATQWRSMESAFSGAVNLQLTATDSPNLANVVSMRSMFRGATAFTGSASMANWNTATITDMVSLFENSTTFNQPIGNWDVSKVTSMGSMFSNARAFNQDLNSWSTANVTNMQSMFTNAVAFNQDLNNWNTAKVTNIAYMFQGATAFNGQIGSWDTSKVTTMISTFNTATAFNQPIGGWQTGLVTDFNSTFATATRFNQPLNNWNVGNALSFTRMFRGASAFNQDLNNWNTAKVTNMSEMFQSATSFNGAVGGWNTSNVVNMVSLFASASAFNKPVNTWDTAKVTNMSGVFNGATVFNQPLDNWNTGNVTNMYFAFSGARAFNQNINNWNTAKVTTMQSMFSGATAFNQPLNSWSVGNVTTMGGMFATASAFNQPLNSWDTSKVTDMGSMFHQASAFNGAIGNWNTSNVTTMVLMFRHATQFNQPIGGWDVSKVTTMSSMLEGTQFFNQPLANWNTGNVKTIGAMFYGSTRFNQPLGTWDVRQVTDMSNTFLSAAMSVENYDSTLKGWLAGGVRNNVPLRATARYCAAESERATLIATYGWTISDVGKGCPAPTVTINAPTKLNNAPITDTTITVNESYADLTINAASVVIGAGTTVGRTGYTCTQVDPKTVTCALTITTNGNLVITATNSGGGSVNRSETGYIVDTIKPNVSASVDTTTGINTPRLSFTATDNVAVARTDVLYYANNGGAGIGAQTTITGATSPVDLVLDPDEAVHHIIIRTYDTAGNMTERDLRFPPIVTFTVPTPISNSTISNATVTVTAPSGNPIDNIVITNAGGTGASISNCVGAGNDTTSPYNQPVTCRINNVNNTGTVAIQARDSGNGAIGQNAQSFTIDTTAPVLHVSAPTKRSNQTINDIVVTVNDDMAIDASTVSAYLYDATGDIVIDDMNCTQVHTSEVSCTLSISGTYGSTAIWFEARDVAGNWIEGYETDFEIDSTPPVLGAIRLEDDSDSGVKGDLITNVTAPRFIFPCTETDSTIEIYVDGESIALLNCDDPEGLVTTLRSFEDGTYAITYVAIDALGNRSEISEPLSITIDTSLPTAQITLATNQTETTNESTARFTVRFNKPVVAPELSMLQVLSASGQPTDAVIQSVEAISGVEWLVTVSGIDEGESVRLLLASGIADLIGNVMDDTEIELIGQDTTVTRLVPVVEPEDPTIIEGHVPGAPNTGLLLTAENGWIGALGAVSAVLLGLYIFAKRRDQRV